MSRLLSALLDHSSRPQIQQLGLVPAQSFINFQTGLLCAHPLVEGGLTCLKVRCCSFTSLQKFITRLELELDGLVITGQVAGAANKEGCDPPTVYLIGFLGDAINRPGALRMRCECHLPPWQSQGSPAGAVGSYTGGRVGVPSLTLTSL